ncbi:GFA family protein [Sphingomonas sp. IC4-52]|uniref:GFA family protein n=1 Tax=Sphingomonas sp. IC4-52 TaxID=2887202 RepID=UPI001D108826|nr:GFA family protein [Sphingomonas sp. IC4-52]MCC2980928.1 GFA family protein [Sphingomonas sp. IC4-52]
MAEDAVTGRCNCGAVSWRIAGSPLAVAACHCTNCRAQSGAAFSVNIVAKSREVTVDGPIRTFEDKATASGQPVLRQFCGQCGSPIQSVITANPAVVAIKAGTADEPGNYAPTIHVWTQSKLPWVDIPDNVPSVARDVG